jgi:hypothetical protein
MEHLQRETVRLKAIISSMPCNSAH